MFLRRYHRTVAGKKLTYYALVESVRTDAGPRQRVVAHLGELNHDQERRWQRTVVFHNRQGEARQLQLFPDDADVPLPDDPDVVRIKLKDVGWTKARRFGDVWLARWLWHHLGLPAIVERHVPCGKHTVPPADIIAIEVINRLCGPCSEFALAEHWYASTGLEDLFGIADADITKDRLYRTLDAALLAQRAIEDDLHKRLQSLFDLDYDLLLYDLTSSYFEGLAENNPLAARGYSRDHRGDCKQIILALVVTREGFPLAHFTLAGNTKDAATLQTMVEQVEQRFGHIGRLWVMDRGFLTKENLTFLRRTPRKYLIALLRKALARFDQHLSRTGWQRLEDNPDIEVKTLQRGQLTYVLVRSLPRRRKERAIRKRQLLDLYRKLKRLRQRIDSGRLKNRDKMLEALGRLKAKHPKAAALLTVAPLPEQPTTLCWSWRLAQIKKLLARDGAYVLQSNQPGWSARQLWETYMQLTVIERAFRVLKSELLLRPIWHQYSSRTQAHVFICVLAYALWKTLDHLLKQAGVLTEIHKLDPDDPEAGPQPRPMTPEVALRLLRQIEVGDILLETTAGQKLALRRVARPDAEQSRLLKALGLELPERLSQDRLL